MRTTETSMGTHGTGATRSAGCGHRCLPPWRLYCVAAWHTAHCRDVALARARPAVVHERSDSSDRRTVLRNSRHGRKWEEMGGKGSTAAGHSTPPPPHPMRVTRPRRSLSLPHSFPLSSPHCALRRAQHSSSSSSPHARYPTPSLPLPSAFVPPIFTPLCTTDHHPSSSPHTHAHAHAHTHVRKHACTHNRTHAHARTHARMDARTHTRPFGYRPQTLTASLAP